MTRLTKLTIGTSGKEMALWQAHPERLISESQLARAKTWLEEASAIIVGIGSGMSAAGGLDYTSPALVQYWYPRAYADGVRSLYELQYSHWRPEKTEPLAYWRYWSRHIWLVRYRLPLLAVYRDLLQWIGEKEVFYVTTNLDGQLYKAGVPPVQVEEAQGDYCHLRCSNNCGAPLTHNEDALRKLIYILQNLDLKEDDLPHCCRCGALVFPAFVPQTAERKAEAKRREDFLSRYGNSSLLFLDIGVGLDTPQIIRFPFERQSEALGARLIRMSYEAELTYRSSDERTLLIDGDLAKAMMYLVKTPMKRRQVGPFSFAY